MYLELNQYYLQCTSSLHVIYFCFDTKKMICRQISIENFFATENVDLLYSLNLEKSTNLCLKILIFVLRLFVFEINHVKLYRNYFQGCPILLNQLFSLAYSNVVFYISSFSTFLLTYYKYCLFLI